jgi:hypothetical protein
MKIVMKLSKSTKGTHVYADSSAEAPVPTIYIKRAALPATPPATITLTIEEGEA